MPNQYPSDVNTFLGQFKGGGARANRFRVEIVTKPGNVSIPETFSFVCRSSHIPGQTIGTVDVPYMGLVAKLPGDRTFDDWTVTIYNDTDWLLRTAFETWVSIMMGNLSNIALNTDLSPAGGTSVYGNAVVHQLNRQGDDIPQAQYTLNDIFPHTVSPIDLAWDANNAVETFDVTFAVNYSYNTKIIG